MCSVDGAKFFLSPGSRWIRKIIQPLWKWYSWFGNLISLLICWQLVTSEKLLDCSIIIPGYGAESSTTLSLVPESGCCSWSANFKLVAERAINKNCCEREQIQPENHFLDPSRGILMLLTKHSGYGALKV